MHTVSAGQYAGSLALGIDLQLLFYINAAGYLILLVGMYFLPQLEGNRDLIRILLMAFTKGTIISWVLFHPNDTLFDNSLLIKAIEIALLVFAFRDMQDSKTT